MENHEVYYGIPPTRYYIMVMFQVFHYGSQLGSPVDHLSNELIKYFP